MNEMASLVMNHLQDIMIRTAVAIVQPLVYNFYSLILSLVLSRIQNKKTEELMQRISKRLSPRDTIRDHYRLSI